MANTNKREKSISAIPNPATPEPGFSSGKPVKKPFSKENDTEGEPGAKTMTTKNVTREKNDNAGLSGSAEVPKA